MDAVNTGLKVTHLGRNELVPCSVVNRDGLFTPGAGGEGRTRRLPSMVQYKRVCATHG